MNTFPVEFYDPLALALNGQRLQDFVDDVLAQYNRLDVAGFSFNEDLLPDFTYSQVQRELKMDVMASFVDLDSPAIPIGTEGDVLSTGKIPRMKNVEYYNEDKLRKLKMLENRRDVDPQAIIDKAGIGVGEIFLNLVSRHANSLSYMRDQVVSAGKFTLNATNNPNGIKGVTFANHVPAANKTTLENDLRWWTSHALSANGANYDPIKDLQGIVKTAKRAGVSRGHFEVNEDFFDDILDLPKVKEAIISNLFPASVTAGQSTIQTAAIVTLSAETKKRALEAVVGAPFVLRDGKARVEKWDNTTKALTYNQMDTFDKYVLVYVPDGTIGEILTVEPILLEGGEYAFAFGRKMALTIGKDYVRKCMSYNSEMTSLVVPNVPQHMYYLYPCEA